MFAKKPKKLFFSGAPEGVSFPTVTYVGTVTPTVSSGVATASSANIGSVSLDRLVVVVLYDVSKNFTTTTHSMTFDGNATTQVAINSQNGTTCQIYALPYSSGATSTIVATRSSNTWTGPVFDIYNVNGLASFTAVGGAGAGGAGATTATASVATNSGGVVIGAGVQQTNASTTATITGTESYVTDHAIFSVAGFGKGIAAHAVNVTANSSSAVTGTWNTAATVSVAAGSWR